MIEPRPEFLDELEAKLRTRHRALQPRRVVRWRAAAAVVILLFAASMLIPSVRSFAQGTVENLFKRAEQDTLPSNFPEDTASPSIEWVEYNTLEEAHAALTADILLPSQLPDGFQLEDVYVASDGTAIRQTYERPGRILGISATTGESYPDDYEVGASAEIIPVIINDVEGAFVEGVWVVTISADGEIEDDAKWIPTELYRRLRWIDGDVRYEIFSMGGSPGHPGYLSMEDMIALAESLE